MPPSEMSSRVVGAAVLDDAVVWWRFQAAWCVTDCEYVFAGFK